MPQCGMRTEADFPALRERLEIHGLDLRHAPSVEHFARFLLERLPRLDYILNNACQTVRRPTGFFEHLLEREAQSLDALTRERCEARCRITTSCAAQSAAARSRQSVPGAGSALCRSDVPREPLRRRRTAGRSARNQQLAPSHARSRNTRAARSAAGERHRAIHSQCAPETADAAHSRSATSMS